MHKHEVISKAMMLILIWQMQMHGYLQSAIHRSVNSVPQIVERCNAVELH